MLPLQFEGEILRTERKAFSTRRCANGIASPVGEAAPTLSAQRLEGKRNVGEAMKVKRAIAAHLVITLYFGDWRARFFNQKIHTANFSWRKAILLTQNALLSSQKALTLTPKGVFRKRKA